jgi:hypothetical protein
MSNTSNRNGVLGCGRCWGVNWQVGGGGVLVVTKTEAAGTREDGTVISWLLKCGEGP